MCYLNGADAQPAIEAILLDVNGMKCGGCAAGVKRRLMERPEVHSAAVNLVTGSAVVSVHSPAATSLSADLSELLTSQVGPLLAVPTKGPTYGPTSFM